MSKENCESKARKKIAASIGATPEEIYFTSGRADGHLKALKAVVKASKKARPHVIITTNEAPHFLILLPVSHRLRQASLNGRDRSHSV